MGQISLSIPQIGQPDTTEDVKIQNCFTTIQNVINGNLDSTNISSTLAQSAGVNAGSTVKGAVSIATNQTTTSTTFTTLSTPDQVTNVVLPANGLLVIAYQAMWEQSTVAAGAQAAIFLGSNQLKIASGTGPVVNSASPAGWSTSPQWSPLFTTPVGLATMPNAGASYPGDVTTGQIIGIANSQGATTFYGGANSGTNITAPGGPLYVFAAAGTYTVSVQFLVASGSVSVENRKLWVEAISLS